MNIEKKSENNERKICEGTTSLVKGKVAFYLKNNDSGRLTKDQVGEVREYVGICRYLHYEAPKGIRSNPLTSPCGGGSGKETGK